MKEKRNLSIEGIMGIKRIELASPIEILSYRVAIRMTPNKEAKIIFIYLYSSEDYGTGNWEATLKFTDEEDPIVGEYHGRPMALNSKSEYASVIDILRNEKPVYFWFIPGEHLTLFTGREEIGEEES